MDLEYFGKKGEHLIVVLDMWKTLDQTQVEGEDYHFSFHHPKRGKTHGFCVGVNLCLQDRQNKYKPRNKHRKKSRDFLVISRVWHLYILCHAIFLNLTPYKYYVS